MPIHLIIYKNLSYQNELQREIGIPNSPISIKIGSIIKNLSLKTTPGPDGFTNKCFQTLINHTDLIKFFQRIKEQQHLKLVL